jgi:methionyl aminopeptidase
MIVKTKDEMAGLKEIGRIVALIRNELIAMVEPGITTAALDNRAKQLFIENNATSAPMLDYEFPGYTCISLNEIAAHGIPADRTIVEGDVVNIDVSGMKNGYYADTGATTIAGDADEKVRKLLMASKAALEAGINAAVMGNRIYHIGRAIYASAQANNFKVIKNLTGHGIGKALHESPHQISNYEVASENQKIKLGHVLAIETFLTTHDLLVNERLNGWELYTSPHNKTAQFEHTVIVTDEGPLVIT